MSLNVIFAIIATVIGLIGFYPYLRDIFRGKTKPHMFTFLIWGITQGIASAGIWFGGGEAGSAYTTVGTIFVFLIFFLSFKYGTKDIKRIDAVVLTVALASIVVWWKLENPVLAILMVSTIDFLGYIPTLRKTYVQPWSESTSAWVLFTVGAVFTFLALEEYNVLTMTFLVNIIVADGLIAAVSYFRRRYVPAPDPKPSD